MAPIMWRLITPAGVSLAALVGGFVFVTYRRRPYRAIRRFCHEAKTDI